MQNVFTWKYWFTVNPGPASPLKIKILIAFLAVLLISAGLSLFFKKKGGIYKGLLRKIYNLVSSNFIIGLILLFFNYENIPFFSSRMWLGFWFLEMITWLFFILKDVKKIPQKIKEFEAEKEIKKYLP